MCFRHFSRPKICFISFQHASFFTRNNVKLPMKATVTSTLYETIGSFYSQLNYDVKESNSTISSEISLSQTQCNISNTETSTSSSQK